MDFSKIIRGLYNKLLLFNKQLQLKKIQSLRKSLDKKLSNNACSIKINAQTEVLKKETDEQLKVLVKKSKDILKYVMYNISFIFIRKM